MVDADDPAIGRVDEKTDPTAITKSDLKRELQENPNLSGEAVEAFADAIADKRSDVRSEARREVAQSLQPNPSNPEVIQIRDAKGRIRKSIPESREGQVSMDVDDRGRVEATIDGEAIHVANVDLDSGAQHEGVGSYQRSLDRYSKRRHPEQRAGGGS